MDLIKKLEEELEDGRIKHKPRPKGTPLPSFEDWCEARGFDGPGITGENKKGGSIPEPTIKGKQTEDL